MNIIETEHLSRRYGRRWALRDCSLAIPAGRVVGLVGHNGAGKTTLLQVVTGLTAPSAGRVSVLGGSPAGSPEALARISFVAQDAPLYRNLSVADTLHLARNVNPRFDDRMASARLDSLAIPRRQRVGRLSGGQQAQVAFTIALARRPDLLVLDEPMATLDPLARQEFLGTLMACVADDGATVLFSSHVVAELERVADHLIVLNSGRVAMSGDVDVLLDAHRLLTGPTDQVAVAAAEVAVVHARAAARQTHLLVRPGSASLPPGWQSRPVGLEELVLAYLNEPTATMRPGPTRSGAADQWKVTA